MNIIKKLVSKYHKHCEMKKWEKKITRNFKDYPFQWYNIL